VCDAVFTLLQPYTRIIKKRIWIWRDSNPHLPDGRTQTHRNCRSCLLSQLVVAIVGGRSVAVGCRSWLSQLVVAIDIRSGCLTIRPHTLEMRD
jgi:hypothetical protein